MYGNAKYDYLGYEEKNTSLTPRFLTKDDIRYIIERLPDIDASTTRASQVVTDGIKKNLEEMLENVKLVPTQEAIDRFVEIMRLQHGLCLVVVGDSIGSNAGAGLSAIITQLTLNTFHRAGFSETVTALRKLENLIHAKTERIDEACIVVFQKRGITFEEALKLTGDYVGCIVSDFIRDYDILKYQDVANNAAANEWLWENHLVQIKGVEANREPVNVFRLYLKTEMMCRHRVTVRKIADVIRSYNNKFDEPLFFVTHGSHLDGVIDIIVSVRGIENVTKNRNVLECAIFEKSVYPFFPSLHVKGIPGIRVWTPVRTKVTALITAEKKLSNLPVWYRHLEDVGIKVEESDDLYLLYLDKLTEVRTGLNYENVKIFFEYIRETYGDLEILHHFEGKRVLIVRCKESPVKYVNGLVKAAAKEHKKEIKAERKLVGIMRAGEENIGRIITMSTDFPRPTTVLRSEYIYVVTQNVTKKLEHTITLFNSLMASPVVDRRYSYSNNMHVMAETLGIEVATASQHYELFEIITGSDAYINPSINVLIIDTIMSRGKPAGATFTGIARHPTNALAASTLERAGSIFTRKSVIGEKKNIRENVSSAICVGLRAPVGTGSVMVVKEIREKGVKRWAVDDEIPTAFMYDENYRPVKQERIEDESNERYEMHSRLDDDGVSNTGIVDVSDRNNIDAKRFSLVDRLVEIVKLNKTEAGIRFVIKDVRSFTVVDDMKEKSIKNIERATGMLQANKVPLNSLMSFIAAASPFYAGDLPRVQRGA